MGITSAAEAKLDARIRPDITILRSRTSYPRRHRPALAVLPGGAEPGPAAERAVRASERDGAAGSPGEPAGRRPPAAAPPASTTASTARPGGGSARPARSAASTRARTAQPAGGASAGLAVSGPTRAAHAAAVPGPIRLTRRGRIVVGVLLVIVVAGVAALIWLAVAGRAQAAGRVRPGTPVTHTMLRVVVRPGQTLWSIAAQADPAADPRIVIQQIVDDNALSGTGIRAGQVLWVPRS